MDRQLGLLWGAVAALLILASPLATTLPGGLMSCPFKGLTGIPCPTCGTTRAALALAHFEPVHALTHYPLPALGWILFLGGGLAAGWRAWRGLSLPRIPRRIPLWARLAFLGAVLFNWAYSIATGV